MKSPLKIATLLVSCLGISLGASSPAFSAPKKIEALFSFEMIGADIAYFESIAGIARSTNTHSMHKNYVVEGCSIEMGYEGHQVDTLSVHLNDQCQFNLKNVLTFQENVPTQSLKFGQGDPSTYYADCLIGCGNAYDPAVHELTIGPRATNWQEILLSSTSDRYEARSKWQDAMIAKEGEDWVMDGLYNCDPMKYNQVAEDALKGEKVDKITIGFDLEKKQQLQFGCDDASASNNMTQSTGTQSVKGGVEHIPFNIAYSSENFVYLVGSQVLSGEVIYEPNDMYGYRFEFAPDKKSRDPLGLPEGIRFVLDDYTERMSDDDRLGAMYRFDIEADLNNPKFENNGCSVRGNASLQIIGVHLYIPDDAESNLLMRSLDTVSKEPFKLSCERF